MDNLLFVHEENIKTKIASNYGGHGDEIAVFYKNVYLQFQYKLLNKKMDLYEDEKGFEEGLDLIIEYNNKVNQFAEKFNIKSQSKLTSSFLEEISVYLFKDNIKIKNETYKIYNKNIYSGLKLDSLNNKITIIKKDVDFCIGKESWIKVDDIEQKFIFPIICVEVKTYLDGTMFGEVQFSSASLKSSNSNVKTYVLMGYNQVGQEKIEAARTENNLSEMFCLRENENSEIRKDVLKEYYKEITAALTPEQEEVSEVGRLLNTNTKFD